MAQRGRNISKIFIILVIVLAVIAVIVWYFGFYYKTCENEACFEKALENCNRAKFIKQASMIFEYKIKGKSNGLCDVNVKLLQGELNNQDSLKLEGREMLCSMPLGIIAAPEDKIEDCHGLLKEGLQDLTIQKLLTYLVQNLGKINSEIL